MGLLSKLQEAGKTECGSWERFEARPTPKIAMSFRAQSRGFAGRSRGISLHNYRAEYERTRLNSTQDHGKEIPSLPG
jgi:hypothetical protein